MIILVFIFSIGSSCAVYSLKKKKKSSALKYLTVFRKFLGRDKCCPHCCCLPLEPLLLGTIATEVFPVACLRDSCHVLMQASLLSLEYQGWDVQMAYVGQIDNINEGSRLDKANEDTLPLLIYWESEVWLLYKLCCFLILTVFSKLSTWCRPALCKLHPGLAGAPGTVVLSPHGDSMHAVPLG